MAPGGQAFIEFADQMQVGVAALMSLSRFFVSVSFLSHIRFDEC